MLEPADCYRALCARDPRFDGVFFVAVSTTGIYCRPVCPARTPARSRCAFFQRAVEAEKAGYRACFRCRPEVAPGVADHVGRGVTDGGTATVDSRARLVRRAAALVDAGFLNDRSVEELGARLGVSGRHVRRAMEQELGVSPVELAQARRLALAKQLLHDTSLPLVEVALASGFHSVRRFNALFAARFGRPPSAVRRARGVKSGPRPPGPEGDGAPASDSADVIRLRLDYRAPLDWSALLAFLAARAIPGVERIDQGRYRRTTTGRAGGAGGAGGTSGASGPEAAGWIDVGPWDATPGGPSASGRPSLEARVSLSLGRDLPRIASRLRALFDLDARPDLIAQHLGHDPLLAPSLAAHPGLRVPGAFDPYEMAIRAVLGQQVTVRGATTLCGRFVELFGRPVLASPPGLDRLFPAPAQIAARSVEELRAIGLPAARARTLRELSAAVADGRIRFEAGAPEATLEALLALPGVGPWTASYLAMRALRWPDAFPAGDLGLHKALGVTSGRQAEARAARWRPWRAYAAMHLWRSLPSSRPGESR